MKAALNRSRHPAALIALAGLLLVGVWLRLDQFASQILLDDEWHAVHRLLRADSWRELFLDFGWADYSIPLGMLYWAQSQWFGLSELGMRWPMLLAALASLGLFSAYAWSRYSPRVAIVFCGFVACSPMLVAFGHMARPYAITLLLSLVSLYAFYRYLEGGRRSFNWGAAYVIGAGLSVWLHLLSAPVLAAPLVLESVRGPSMGRAVPWQRLARVAVATATLLAILLIPPLVENADVLVRKAGVSTVGPDTVWGAAFLWFGTSSALALWILLGLSALGMRRALQRPVAQATLVGLGLTLLLILVARPRYSNNSLTFARYLLPALPLLLLAAACGVDWLLERGVRWRRALLACLLGFGAYYLAVSPLQELLRRPNSSINQLSFLFDFRYEHNAHARHLEENLPLSNFWTRLGSMAPNSQRIAVAPFYFESFYWDSARWERVGRQRILPAYLEGFCANGRDGEVPRDGRFRFRNVFYLSDLGTGAGALDWLVFNRPLPGFESSERGRREARRTQACLSRLVEQLGPPEYEDDVLVAFRLAGRFDR